MDTTNLLFTILFFLILFYLYLTLSKQNTTEEFTNVPKQTSSKVKKYLNPFDLTEFSFFIQLIVDADEFSKIKENSDMVNTTYWIGLQKYMVDSLKKGLKLNVIKYKIKLSDKEIDDKVDQFTNLFYSGKKEPAKKVISDIFKNINQKESTRSAPVPAPVFAPVPAPVFAPIPAPVFAPAPLSIKQNDSEDENDDEDDDQEAGSDDQEAEEE